MPDYLSLWISPEHIRDWTVTANVVAAFFIGPYLAFAATPDAGFYCPQALIRMVHRVILVGLSLSLMNNAMVIVSGGDGDGSTFGVFIFILLSTTVSGLRYKLWMADIPLDATWAHPHFSHRETDKEHKARVG